MKRAALALAGTACFLAACASILGIEELPVKEESVRDAGRDRTAPPVDAGIDAKPCTETPATGCACPHTFCDDFDDASTPVGARWLSTLTPTGGAFINSKTPGGASVGYAGEPVSAPNTFEAKLYSDNGSAYAFLFNRLAHQRGANFQGVRFRFHTRIKELVLNESRGPVDGGSIVVGGLFTESIPPAGVVIAATPGAVILAAADTDVLDENSTATSSVAYDGNVLEHAQTPITVELYVVTRDRAVAEGLEMCSLVPAPNVAALRIAGLAATCMALPTTLSDPAWTTNSLVGLGAGTFGMGSANILHDNAMVDFFE